MHEERRRWQKRPQGTDEGARVPAVSRPGSCLRQTRLFRKAGSWVAWSLGGRAPLPAFLRDLEQVPPLRPWVRPLAPVLSILSVHPGTPSVANVLRSGQEVLLKNSVSLLDQAGDAVPVFHGAVNIPNLEPLVRASLDN